MFILKRRPRRDLLYRYKMMRVRREWKAPFGGGLKARGHRYKTKEKTIYSDTTMQKTFTCLESGTHCRWKYSGESISKNAENGLGGGKEELLGWRAGKDMIE